MTKVYLMKSKDQALNSLLQFFTDVGIPDKIVYDGAREFSSQAWRQELAKRHVAWHQTEPYHQHQNQAEPRVCDIKMLALELLSTSGAPDNYWCYAIELAEDLLNFRAVESLNWRTPFECCKGETPDISPLYQFAFFEKVRYATANSNIQFPENKDNPGIYLGVSWNVGDLLTYKIQPDHPTNIKRHSCLSRSAVACDDGSPERLNK